jgi:hypothetical protein
VSADTARADYIAGLRLLADALEADPSLPLPTDYSDGGLSFQLRDRKGMAAWVRLLAVGAKESLTADHGYGPNYNIDGRIAGLPVHLYTTARRIGRTVRREVEQFEIAPFLTGSQP